VKPAHTGYLVDQGYGAAIWIEQTVAASRPNCRLIEASFDRNDREPTLGRQLVRSIAEGSCLGGIDDRVSEMTIQLAEVLFLTAPQDLFAARERKRQHRYEISTRNYQQDTQDEFRANMLSNYQRLNQQDIHEQEEESGSQ
jgi:hypothetical protein